jgi:hypothetical protein
VTVNLFRMALNCFRMRQLTDLMVAAYRGNEEENNCDLDRTIRRNMSSRRECCFWEEGVDGGEIEQLDLQLRLELIQSICRRKYVGGDYVPRGGFESLALFTWGEAYRETTKFFLEAGKRFMGLEAETIFRAMIARNRYLMEVSMMEAGANKLGVLPLSPRAKNLTGDVWLLPYQGAQVIEAYERVFNARIGPGWMISEPLVPFDLYSMIELQYQSADQA